MTELSTIGLIPRSEGPTFFVIGAQKAGTSRFCELLSRHTDIAIPIKEPFYFSKPETMQARAASYRQLFAEVRNIPHRGDGSTDYSMAGLYPGTAARIFQFNDRAKIIYLVRDPIQRIESAWPQLLSIHQTNRFTGFNRSVRETPLLIEPSLYWRQLSEYRQAFPDDQLKVVLFEEFVKDELSTVSECFQFLGLSGNLTVEVNDAVGLNARADKRQRWLIADAVQASASYRRLKHLVPQPFKTLFTYGLTSPVAQAVTWDASTLEWVKATVAPDSQQILRYVGAPPDYWGMAPGRPAVTV